ncbi:MAG: sn-glycerol-3-phosphate ABC transporter ATP-binding protein UgpC [Hyphomicrobiales bacterium]|nr:sn-glycerol-3-phosphate ABC transporter ATP-binding protein UgpC [Hyphomicrobiales bacterium]
MAGVLLDRVEKTYPGGFNAVKGISFAVPDGGFCVLVGPSGCGKSTLLRMIAGLETITGGQVRIGERVVNDIEPMGRDIAMVFQNYALYPHMSVYDNMAYGLRNLKTPEPEILSRVQEAAKILELNDEMLKRKPRQLSGGQRQRVAMGRAIVRKPAVFLFDEPLSNLDAKLRVQMRIEIRKLQRRLKTTSIYVTHDQLEAMTLADMLVVMNAGRVEQVGAPLELYERPATAFVAGFLGSPPMNFLNGRVEKPGVLRLGDGTELAYDPAHFTATSGAEIQAGVRPERIIFSKDGSGIPFKLELVEELGLGQLVHGVLADASFTVALPAGVHAPVGDAQRVTIAPDAVHLFDRKTGARL